jgi:hypothetical protein
MIKWRAVEDALGNENILPESAGDSIVPRVEVAAGDDRIGAVAQMHAIPSAGDSHVLDIHLVGPFDQHRVIRGIYEVDIAEGEVARVTGHQRMRSPLLLFTFGIPDLVAIDGAFAADPDVLGSRDQYQRPLPFGTASLE